MEGKRGGQSGVDGEMRRGTARERDEDRGGGGLCCSVLAAFQGQCCF